MVTYCLFAEELARGSLSLAAVGAMQSLMGTHFIYKYGGEALRQRYLVPALRGQLVATFALTEPDAGSGLARVTPRAAARGGGGVARLARAREHPRPPPPGAPRPAPPGRRARPPPSGWPSASPSSSTRRLPS